ncbi:MAG: nicotinate-nucleotide adenylyltransferase [Tepidisphaeraceae bacterium]|jgi:nicotinate-nucleotide adenylyltransferase
MMRFLCFGGSFNPIHNGHLVCARATAERLGYDRVILIPAAHPPHKPAGAEFAEPGHRLAMCRLAAALQPQLFEVDDIELHRPPPSYTIDTVRQLKQMRHWEQVEWLIGADMLMYLPKWRDPEALLRETKFVVVQRPGTNIEWNALPPTCLGLRYHLAEAPLLDISSTDIRQRVATGRSIEYLVPSGVAEYIREHGLYRAG